MISHTRELSDTAFALNPLSRWHVAADPGRPGPPCPRLRTQDSGLKTQDSRLENSRLDEDALAGAFLGGLDCDVFLTGGDHSQSLGALGVALLLGEDGVTLPDVRQPVIEKDEHVWGDLLTQTVAGAEILIDPNLHVRMSPGSAFGAAV